MREALTRAGVWDQARKGDAGWCARMLGRPAGSRGALAAPSQLCLRRFVSAPYKDSRAPQNLYPIAGLERELRRSLGDPRLLYHALRQAAHPRPAAGQAMKFHSATVAKRPATALQGTTATATRAFRAVGPTTVRHVPLPE